MTTKYINLYGEAYWTKVQPHDTDTYLGIEKWCLDLKMNSEQVEEFKKLGLKTRLKDLDGGKVARFTRKVVHKIKGEDVKFDPPDVLIYDDKTKGYIPFTDKIGNGSKVMVSLEVYSYKTPDGQVGSAARLRSVSVSELVIYEPTKSTPPPTEGKATPWG